MPGNEFHYQEVAITLAKVIHYLWQRLMMQIREQRRFTFKRSTRFLIIGGERLFERDDTNRNRGLKSGNAELTFRRNRLSNGVMSNIPVSSSRAALVFCGVLAPGSSGIAGLAFRSDTENRTPKTSRLRRR